VARAALGRDVAHFAYPFGDRASFGRQHVGIVEQAGFASATTALPGLIRRGDPPNLHALPRIAWDRRHSLRALRVMLSGMMTGAGRMG
jgi:peptidoglycan/xylan/chitin deacetylase (PgdA/CDA1 family)